MKASQSAGSPPLIQRQTVKARLLEIDGEIVFGSEARLQHIELQRADDADDLRRAVERHEHLHDPLLRHLAQRLA